MKFYTPDEWDKLKNKNSNIDTSNPTSSKPVSSGLKFYTPDEYKAINNPVQNITTPTPTPPIPILTPTPTPMATATPIMTPKPTAPPKPTITPSNVMGTNNQSVSNKTMNNNAQFKTAIENPQMFAQSGFDFAGYKKYYDALPQNEKLNLFGKKLTPEEVAYKYNPTAYGEIVSGNINDAGVAGSIFSGVSKGIFNIKGAARGIANTISGLFTGKKDAVKEDPGIDAFQKARAKEMDRKSFAQNIPENLAQIVTQMAPSIAAGGTPGLVLSGTQAGGLNAQQALDEGATPGQALLYGGTTGLAEGYIEKFGFIPGLDGNVIKGLSGASRKNLQKIAGNYLKKSAAEGLEEVAMEPIQNITKGLIYDDKISFNPFNKETYGDNGILPLQRMAESGALGFLAGNVLGGVQVPSQITAAKQIQQEIGNNFSNDVRAGLSLPQNTQSYKQAQYIGSKGLDVTVDEYSRFTDQLRRDFKNLIDNEMKNMQNQNNYGLKSMGGQPQKTFNFKNAAQDVINRNNQVNQQQNDNILPEQNVGQNQQNTTSNFPEYKLKRIGGGKVFTQKDLQDEITPEPTTQINSKFNIGDSITNGKSNFTVSDIKKDRIILKSNNTEWDYVRQYVEDNFNVSTSEKNQFPDGGNMVPRSDSNIGSNVPDVNVENKVDDGLSDSIKNFMNKRVDKDLQRYIEDEKKYGREYNQDEINSIKERFTGNIYYSAMKTKQAIADKDFNTLTDILHRGNDISLKVFSEITGKSTQTQRETNEGIRSLDPEAYDKWKQNKIDENKSKEIAYKEEQKSQKEREKQEKYNKIANRPTTYKGERKTFKEWVTDRFNEGYKVKSTNEYGGFEFSTTESYIDLKKFTKEQRSFIKAEYRKYMDKQSKIEAEKEQAEYDALPQEDKDAIDSLFEKGGTKTTTQQQEEPKQEQKKDIEIDQNTGYETKESMAKDIPDLIQTISNGEIGYEGEAFGLGKTGARTLNRAARTAINELRGITDIYPDLKENLPDEIIDLMNGKFYDGILDDLKNKINTTEQIQNDNASIVTDIKNDSIEATADAAEKPAKFKNGLTKIKIWDSKANSEIFLDIPSKIYKGLAVHRNIKRPRPLTYTSGFTVSHNSSGVAIVGFSTEKSAKLYAQILADTINTELPLNELSAIFKDEKFDFHAELIKWVEQKSIETKVSNEDRIYNSLNDVMKNSLSPDELVDKLILKGNTVSGFTLPMREQIMKELIQGVISGDPNIQIKVKGDGELTIVNSPAAISAVLNRLKIQLPEQLNPPRYEKQQQTNDNATKKINETIQQPKPKKESQTNQTKEQKQPDKIDALVEKMTELVDTLKNNNSDKKTMPEAKPETKPESEQKDKPTETSTQNQNAIDRIEQFEKNAARGESFVLSDFMNEVNFILNNEDAIKQELNSYTVNELKKKANPYSAYNYQKKQEYVDGIYKDYLTYIYYASTGKDTISYSMGKGTIYDSLINQINKALQTLTQEKLDEIQANNKVKYEESLEKKKKRIEGFKNPTTLEEFESKKRITKLSPEEQVKYDELYALDRKAKREAKKQESPHLSSATIGEYQIIEDVDTRDNSKLWVIKLKNRVTADEFNKIRDSFKRFDISYSRFKQGFISNSDPTNVLKQITGEMPLEANVPEVKNNAQKLFELANNMQKEIDNLKRPRLDNTARRARMADNAMEQAEALERMQATLRNIAQAMQDGNLNLINNIDSRVQINTLMSVLNRAKIKYSDENLNDIRNDYNKWREARANIKDTDAILFAELPQDTIYSDRLKDIANKIEGKKGYTLIANRFKKALQNIKQPKVIKLSEQLKQDLEKVINEIDTFNFLEEELSQRKRLERLGIESNEELRAYLREFIQYMGKRKESGANEKIKKMERELIGKKFEGYFPTPKPIIEQMLEYADIQDGDKILEPSAGKGNIADAIKENIPDANIDVIEIQPALRNVLEAKGYNIVAQDFTNYNGTYDKIIMNPPFENLQDVDHVLRAYSLLNPGGKIVAIMSESPFFRQDKKATAFREWLDSVGGTSEKLPEGSFKNSERSTGVNTRIVVIEKENVISDNAKSLKDIEAELSKDVDANTPDPERLGITPFGSNQNSKKNKKDTASKVMRDEVADRFNRAKNIKSPLTDKVLAKIEEIKKNITRGKFAELERGAKYAELRFKLLQFSKGKDIALTRVLENLHGIVSGMKPKEYELFNLKVVFMDLLEDAKAGKPLPYGLDGLSEVEDILRNIESEISDNQSIPKAIEKRNQLWVAMKNEYIKSMKSIGFNVDNRFQKENYFRHLVIEHVQKNRLLTGTGKKLKTPKGSGFLKKRMGSEMDIASDYLQAESEVMAQMMFDMERAKLIKYIETSQHNIIKQLKTKAKSMNDDLMESVYNLEASDGQGGISFDKKGNRDSETEKTMKKYASYMAMSFIKLENMESQGNLWKGEKGEFSNISFINRDNLDETNKLFKYLSELAKLEDEPGNIEARTILKYHKMRESLVRETLGDNFKTWEKIIPEGYSDWQADKGNAMYLAYSVPEEIAQKLVDGMIENTAINKSQLRQVLAQGLPHRQMVLPNEVIATIENLMKDEMQTSYIKLLNAWKQWQLLSPRRFLKYNLRNITGDMDHVFLGNPATFKKIPEAMNDLYRVMILNKSMEGNLKDWFERGGMSSFLQVQEMGDINKLKMFIKTAKGKDYNFIRKYWKTVRLSTDFREAILRYATYLSYLEQIKLGGGKPKNYGASIPSEINALKDNRDKAYQLSNDLLGAYDDISSYGERLRKRWIPFYSFMETNMKIYYRTIKNAMNDPNKMATLGRATVVGGKKLSFVTAKNIGRVVLGMFALTAMLEVWNNLFFGDEEEELPEDVKKRVHIVLGRDDNGRPIHFTRLGALSDLLEWFGLGTPMSDIKEVLNGRKTLKELIKEMAISPVNKAVNSALPFVKMGTEFLMGQSLFPDVTKPKVIRDRGEYIANSLGLGAEYKAIFGKPTRGYKDSLSDFIVYKSDPKENAYYSILDAKLRFEKQQGKNTGRAFFPDEKSNALYNYKLSLRYKDKEAADKYLNEYIKYGGTKDGYMDSMRSLSPTAGLQDKKDAFIQSLTPEEQAKLEIAQKFYEEMLSMSEFVNGEYAKAAIQFGELRSENDKLYKKMKDGEMKADPKVIQRQQIINRAESILQKANKAAKYYESIGKDTKEIEKAKTNIYEEAAKYIMKSN